MKTGYDQFFKQARQSSPAKPVAKRKGQSLEPRQRKTHFPWRWILFSLFGCCVTVSGIYYFDEIDIWMSKVEVSMSPMAIAEESKTATSATNAEKSQSAASAGVASAVPAVESAKTSYTTDELNHFARLNERKTELDQREQELNRMEDELLKQREVLEKKMVELDETRRKISSVLEERVQIDEKKVETLVQLYSNMKPQQAAKVIETIDEDLAVQILGRMKKKSAADIMNLLKAEKAQVISEKYAGFKR